MFALEGRLCQSLPGRKDSYDTRIYIEREMDGWMDGLLYNQWIDRNNIVGERRGK